MVKKMRNFRLDDARLGRVAKAVGLNKTETIELALTLLEKKQTPLVRHMYAISELVTRLLDDYQRLKQSGHKFTPQDEQVAKLFKKVSKDIDQLKRYYEPSKNDIKDLINSSCVV